MPPLQPEEAEPAGVNYSWEGCNLLRLVLGSSWAEALGYRSQRRPGWEDAGWSRLRMLLVLSFPSTGAPRPAGSCPSPSRLTSITVLRPEIPFSPDFPGNTPSSGSSHPAFSLRASRRGRAGPRRPLPGCPQRGSPRSARVSRLVPSSHAGHGGDQSVFARAGAVAEISRSGDGDDHNKGREVRDGGGGGLPPHAWLNLVSFVRVCGGGIAYGGREGDTRVFAKPRGWGCGFLTVVRSRLSWVRSTPSLRGCATAPGAPAEPGAAVRGALPARIQSEEIVSSGFFLNQNSWIVKPNFRPLEAFQANATRKHLAKSEPCLEQLAGRFR